MPCIEVQALTHRFADQVVLDAIDLQVPEGSICGFLGANGAGKTTTLRLMLGLLSQQSGEIRLFGERLADNRIGILRRTGSMIESPSFYDHLSAAENLRLQQIVHHCPRRAIDDTLALVGLGGVGRKRTAHFSLGMKQRLGLAIALLHQPDLLILDEPTNGLDPNGIVEIRALLQRLNAERGLTILVSSHLLAEIDKLATDLCILDRGRVVFQGPTRELHARQRQAQGLELRTTNDAAALAILRDMGITARHEAGTLYLSGLSPGDTARLNRTLVTHGVDVHHLAVGSSDLEHIFLELIDGRARAAG